MESKIMMLRESIKALLLIYTKKTMLQSRKEKIRLTLIKLLVLHERMFKNTKNHRSVWVKPLYTVQQRALQGDSSNLIELLKFTDQSLYFNYLRMSVDCFEELYSIIGPRITKQFCVREPIAPHTRLQICLRYLASGDCLRSVGYAFRVSPNTISHIIREVCDAIWQELKNVVLEIPNEEKWIKIAEDFEEMWNYPHCIGAIDGKHIIIEAPPHSGSSFYNYKKAHSFNLTAVSDAYYRFILVDVGKEGRCSDAGVFAMSAMKPRLEADSLNVPKPSMVGQYKLPYVLVGDEAYPLTPYLMRPYPKSSKLDLHKKVYNYRHCRARRVVESAFGLSASRWRIFRRPINTFVPKAEMMVLASICLHNFIITRELQKRPQDRRYLQHNDEDLERLTLGIVNENQNVLNTNNNKTSSTYRDTFMKYFFNEGAVEWQWDKAANNEF